MSNDLVPTSNYSLSPAEYALLEGDLSRLDEPTRLNLYNAVCASVGLNPLTSPFEYIKLNGKLKLYAKKDCTDQLRKVNGVSIVDLSARDFSGVYIVTAKAQDKTGRSDVGTGAVALDGLKGEALCNALMKCETKAKRRVTLSICGLGVLDESEVVNIPGAETVAHSPILTTSEPPSADPDPLTARRRVTLLAFKEHFDPGAIVKCVPAAALLNLNGQPIADGEKVHLGKTFANMNEANLARVAAWMHDPTLPEAQLPTGEPTDAELVASAQAHIRESNAE